MHYELRDKVIAPRASHRFVLKYQFRCKIDCAQRSSPRRRPTLQQTSPHPGRRRARITVSVASQECQLLRFGRNLPSIMGMGYLGYFYLFN